MSNMKKRTDMGKEEFYGYILDNFTLSAEAQRIISNILTYVELNAPDNDEAHKLLSFFLDGTIGITDEEIRMFTIE